jgi:hypothetical protein
MESRPVGWGKYRSDPLSNQIRHWEERDLEEQERIWQESKRDKEEREREIWEMASRKNWQRSKEKTKEHYEAVQEAFERKTGLVVPIEELEENHKRAMKRARIRFEPIMRKEMEREKEAEKRYQESLGVIGVGHFKHSTFPISLMVSFNISSS